MLLTVGSHTIRFSNSGERTSRSRISQLAAPLVSMGIMPQLASLLEEPICGEWALSFRPFFWVVAHSESTDSWRVAFSAFKLLCAVVRPALFESGWHPKNFPYVAYACADASAAAFAAVREEFGCLFGACYPHKIFGGDTSASCLNAAFVAAEGDSTKGTNKLGKDHNESWMHKQITMFHRTSSLAMFKNRMSVLTSEMEAEDDPHVDKIKAIIEKWSDMPYWFHNASGIDTVGANNMLIESWHRCATRDLNTPAST